MANLDDFLMDLQESGIKVVEKEKSVKLDDLSVSFKDCPNKCVNGYYINPYKRKKVKCEYCADKRLSLVHNKVAIDGEKNNLAELLNLPKSFTGYGAYNIDSIIPAFASKDMIKESVDVVSDKLKELLDQVTAGRYPSYSIMFNLGKKAFENNFIYSYLVRSYLSGLTTCPYLTDFDICVSRNEAENSYGDSKFKDYLEYDVCVIVISSGATYNSLNVVKGFMQLRANKDKSTLIFTNSWGSKLLDLCTEDDVKCKNLAYLYSIEYSKKFEDNERKREEANMNTRPNLNTVGLSSKAFDNLMKSNNSI